MSRIAPQKHVPAPTVAQLPQLTPDLYREIFIHSHEAIAIIGPQGQYIEQNGAHFQLLGYSDSELEGKTPAIHLGEEEFARIAAELTANGTYQGEIISHTKDGKERHIELSAFAMRNSVGEPVCYIGIKRDITARRRAQQRLALQYAVTRILSVSTDFRSIIPEVLHAICDCLGWQVGLLWQVNGSLLSCVDSWHEPGANLEQFEERSRSMTFERGIGLPGRIWSSGEPAWIENVTEDRNSPREIDAAAVGLRGAFGFPITVGNEVLGIAAFFDREIRQPDEELLRVVQGLGAQIGLFQERIRAEKELASLFRSEKSARSEAEKANRLKDEFLATLSHELRTPLNAVIGWSRMLRMGRLDSASCNHALEVIERNAWAQQQIIEDILDVSRVITGKLQLQSGPVRIDSVVEAAVDAVRPALQAKEIQIESSFPENLSVIRGDADRLRQVVWNLLSNAAKFTPVRGSVRTSVIQEQGRVRVVVEDTGPGIDPQFLPHVFERFRQADGSTTRTHGGLGLGLAIVRHLVELHGGTISAQNRSGEKSGAIFTVILPVPSHPMITKVEPDGDDDPEAQCSSIQLKGLRVLAVDDESDALDLITIELTQYGASVTGTSSSKEALAAMETQDFDIIVADIGMPDIDGYELIKRIRQNEAGRGKQIPAVALTAYARVQDRMRAVVSGYNTHVAKPIEINELLTVVASLTGRYDRNLSLSQN